VYQPRKMELERETRSFAGVAQLAPGKTEALFASPYTPPAPICSLSFRG